MPTHFVRNSISNINVRKYKEFHLVSNKIEEVVRRTKNECDSLNGLGSNGSEFLARGRSALLDSALEADPNHPLEKSQLNFVRIFLNCLK